MNILLGLFPLFNRIKYLYFYYTFVGVCYIYIIIIIIIIIVWGAAALKETVTSSQLLIGAVRL